MRCRDKLNSQFLPIRLKNYHTVTVVLVLLLMGMSPVVAATETSDPDVLFKRALKLRETGNLQAAIRSFHGILSNHPQLQRARLELAVAYFHALNFGAAKREAKVVLMDPKTPAEVKTKIRLFLEKIEASGPKHTFKPFVHLGWMHDSNVTAGPDDALLSGFPTLLVAKKVGDQAALVQVGVAHRYIARQSVRLNESSAALLWLSRANWYRTDYRQTDALDLDVLSVSSGPALIVAQHARAGLNTQIDYIRLGNNSYAQFMAVNPNFTWIRSNHKTEITLDLQWQVRNYLRAADTGRDSQFTALGLSYGRLGADDKLSHQLGVRVFREQADADASSNDGTELFFGVSFRSTRKTSYFARASRKFTEYAAPEIGFSVAREDTLDRFVIGRDQRFSRGRMKDWEIKMHWTRTENSSNIPAYTYDRNQIDFSLGRSF